MISTNLLHVVQWFMTFGTGAQSMWEKLQELIRRWDNECELFYDDIANVLQNTKREPTLFNKLDDR